MALTIESACGIAAARPWADRWNALAQRAPQRLAMLSHAWVDAYAEALMPADATLHCLFAHAGGDLLGVLPLVVRANGRAPVLLHSASTPYHAHSAFGDLLVDPRRADEAVPALLAQACCHPGLRLREIALRGIAMESPTTALPDRLPGEIAVRQGHRGWGSYLRIEGIWGDYHAGLSKNFRANLRKARTRSRSLATAELRFVWRPAGQASASDLENFLNLEASGWKGRAGSAIGQDARLQRFYARLTENAARLGWLEWHFLYMGERPVAAHMVLRVGRALNLLKIAYDETHAHLSPGSLLFEAAARRAFESGDTDEINCLTDMEWHRGWGMQRREFRDARLYPPTAVAIVFGLLPRRIVEAAKALAVRARSLGRIAASLRKSRST